MCDAVADADDVRAAVPRPAAGAGGPAFEPIIGATVRELTAMAPDLVVPGHCTGWRAQHALAASLPNAWTAGSSGSTFRLAAA